jgi:superfamily I DNA/RNA helicase
MQALSISHCASRKKYGQLHPCHPSRFLSELPHDLVERADEQSKKPVAPEAVKSMFAAIRAAVE